MVYICDQFNYKSYLVVEGVCSLKETPKGKGTFSSPELYIFEIMSVKKAKYHLQKLRNEHKVLV